MVKSVKFLARYKTIQQSEQPTKKNCKQNQYTVLDHPPLHFNYLFVQSSGQTYVSAWLNFKWLNEWGRGKHTLYFSFFFFQFKGSKIHNPWRWNLTVYKSHSQWFPCPPAHLHTRQKKYLTLMHNLTVSHQCSWIHVNPIIWIVMLLCLCFVSRVFIREVFRDRSHQRTVYLNVNVHDIQI